MRSSSAVGSSGSAPLVAHEGVAGFHRRSLSLAEQRGRKVDGNGVRLGGKWPAVLEFVVWFTQSDVSEVF